MAARRQEQDALVAFFNSFRLSKRVASFDQLSDGKALMEVMSNVDSTHFKNVSSRGAGAPNSPDNWVLKMNTLKRLHRLLLTYRLPSPHPSSFTSSSLPEPAFSAIAKSPTTTEGRNGLLQICRICLTVSVWAPGNEKIIQKIQSLEEGHMAALMKSIEGVMETFPAEDLEGAKGSTSRSAEPSPPPSASNSREERDKLLQENDDLRARCEQMMQQVEALTISLDEARNEKEEPGASRLDTSQGPGAGLRTSQTSSTQVDTLRFDLAKAEEHLAITEADLEKQTRTVSDLEKTVESLKVQAAEASRLKDQLDEHRHLAERLRKSENVVEKYKKKLDESAGLRRELRTLEEENASLIDRNAALEADTRRAGSSKSLIDTYKAQLEALEHKSRDQDAQIADLTVQLENSRAELADVEDAHDRDREELHMHQERAKELELGGTSIKRSGSKATLLDPTGNTFLGDEIGAADVEISAGETKTDLRLRIKALERDLEAATSSGGGDASKISSLQSLLVDANRARDRYQSEYLEEHRSALRLEAALEQIRAGRGGDSSQTAAALQQRSAELLEERGHLLKEKAALETAKELVEKQLRDAKTNLSLVDKDKQEQVQVLRESIASETADNEQRVNDLRDQLSRMKDKERAHLEEIKKLLMDKVDLQSAGISQREKVIEREKEFSDIRAALTAGGASSELQDKIAKIQERNVRLDAEVKNLTGRLEGISEDPLAKTGGLTSPGIDDTGNSAETRINTLKEKLQRARATNAALERRYRLEQQLMLSAWHELGSRTVRDHITAAGVRKVAPKPAPTSWLGRQRKHQEEAAFTRI